MGDFNADATYNIVNSSTYRIVKSASFGDALAVKRRAADAKKTRVRRTVEDAQRLILDAAEKRLAAVGPAGLRLQDVATDAGISHPLVLHHFGSREGLVAAVIARAVEALQRDLIEAMTREAANNDGGPPPDGSLLFERVFETLRDKGHARLMAWLLLSGYDPLDAKAARDGWAAIAAATHQARIERFAPKDANPSYEDTLFTIVLSALTLFAQAIAGASTFRAAGLGHDADAERRFRAWLAALLARHMEQGDVLPPQR